EILAVTRKELDEYTGSLMALIFIGAFLAATLFAFFWVDTFFARGIADVRPLFRRMMPSSTAMNSPKPFFQKRSFNNS
ncbi:MAG: hypothetical protein R6U50_17475, partial [Desulfobacterales bacterium]